MPALLLRARLKVWIWPLMLGMLLCAPTPADGQQPDHEPNPYALSENAAEAAGWRTPGRSRLPGWLRVSGSYRLRYERLTDPFRSGGPGDADVLVHRALILADLRLDPVFVGAELQDARAFMTDANTPLNTSMINAAELLQAYVGVRLRDVFEAGSETTLRAGRLTIDMGSRRLIARNRFRNTLNAFTGVEAWWAGSGDARAAGFFTAPVQRRPAGSALLDNEAAFDEENFNVLFWGLFGAVGGLPWSSRGEVYLFGLHEQDDADLATRNRKLVTPGVRWFRPPRTGTLDFEVESVLQVGRSRSTTAATDTTYLDHLACFYHVALGYTVPAPWAPRLVVEYDLAGGDRDPTDRRNNRFDTLFGAGRFDSFSGRLPRCVHRTATASLDGYLGACSQEGHFGPTGMYGLIARSNINTPGVRVEGTPGAGVDGFLGYRAVWLAAGRDALTTRGIRDATGGSGRFVGHQIEGRGRVRVLSNHVHLEAGFAYFVAGGFLKRVPDGPGGRNTAFFYAQATLSF